MPLEKENGIIFDFVIRFGYIIEFYKDVGGHSKVLYEEHCGAPGLGFEINIVFVESVAVFKLRWRREFLCPYGPLGKKISHVCVIKSFAISSGE